MFCHNCGTQVNGSRYCPNCGAVQNNNQPLKPVVTNVGVDDTLPKNGNFLIVLLLLFIIVISGIAFLSGYKEQYDYKQSIVYNDYKVYLPIGYKAQIGDEEEKEDAKKQLYISNDSVKYQFNYYADDYSNYNTNDYKEIKEFLNKFGYTVLDVNEKEFNGHRMIVAKFKTNDKEMYFYLYEAKKYELVYMGYMSAKSDIDDHIKKLAEILSKVEHV